MRAKALVKACAVRPVCLLIFILAGILGGVLSGFAGCFIINVFTGHLVSALWIVCDALVLGTLGLGIALIMGANKFRVLGRALSIALGSFLGVSVVFAVPLARGIYVHEFEAWASGWKILLGVVFGVVFGVTNLEKIVDRRLIRYKQQRGCYGNTRVADGGTFRVLKLLGAFSWFCSAQNREIIEAITADLKKDTSDMRRESRGKFFVQCVLLWHVVARTITPIMWDGVCRLLAEFMPVGKFISKIKGPFG